MKHRIYGVAVEEYPQYTFKSIAVCAEDAENNIRHFLNKPFARCKAISNRKSELHVRETESCRMQVVRG